jgi:3-oxoacyl-[acyl-carrier protein] reductase
MPKTPDYFQNKTIVITGAGSGIGRATALIFAREGASVLCADIDGAAAQETVDQVNATGAQAVATTTDVCDRNAVENMIGTALSAYGAVDFLFNSAGSAVRRSKFLDIDDDLWKRTYDLNVNGVLYGMQAALPHMLAAGKGVIVNMASMSHKRGGAGASVHYASAKGAVFTMTLGVAREFADKGIRCLSISPGPIDTAFQKSAATSAELMAQFRNDVPMKRFGEAEEIGELVLFMCSDACEFMTADTVYVNGGGGWR